MLIYMLKFTRSSWHLREIINRPALFPRIIKWRVYFQIDRLSGNLGGNASLEINNKIVVRAFLCPK